MEVLPRLSPDLVLDNHDRDPFLHQARDSKVLSHKKGLSKGIGSNKSDLRQGSGS